MSDCLCSVQYKIFSTQLTVLVKHYISAEMIIKLSDNIDHEQFMWSRSHAEVKDNFVEIISDLIGVLPDHSKGSIIYSSS